MRRTVVQASVGDKKMSSNLEHFGVLMYSGVERKFRLCTQVIIKQNKISESRHVYYISQ